MIPYASFDYEDKKECNVFLIERNEMIVLNNIIIIVWNIDKKDNQHNFGVIDFSYIC